MYAKDALLNLKRVDVIRRYIILILFILLLTLPVYAAEPVDIQIYTVRYSNEAISNHELTIFNRVGFKDFVAYYPFLYPNLESESYSFDIALFDNGVLYEVKSVTFSDTSPDDPESLTKDVDFVWTSSDWGDHDLKIVYDYSNRIDELREDNNVFNFNVYVFSSKKDRYLRWGKDNKLFLLFAIFYLAFLVYYIMQKKKISK